MTSDPSGGTADHIETFIGAAKKAFEGMMGVKITRADVQRHSELAKGFDVSAIIGLTDLSSPQREMGLSVVVSFPEHVARKAVARILGIDDLPAVDEDVADGVGELLNVLVGVAKRGLGSLIDSDWTVTLPTVVLGSQHRVFRMREVNCDAVRFSSEIGEFLLQVFLRPSTRSATAF